MRPAVVSTLFSQWVVSLAAADPVKVYLCGDSTMARARDNTQGWGEYLQYSLDATKATVVNRAIGGRSTRSYTREGRFDEVANEVQKGDWVVIEFGHNDGGSLNNDNGRSVCFGGGEETCQSVYDGKQETIHTFPWYLKQAGQKFLEKGARVILSDATPNNVWETGRFQWGPSRFHDYTWLATQQLGGPAAGVHFVPHGPYSAQAMQNLGADVVNANYPNDHTHTSPRLADIMAQAFVLGLKCGTSELGTSVVINATASMEETFLGPCLSGYNQTVTDLLR